MEYLNQKVQNRKITLMRSIYLWCFFVAFLIAGCNSKRSEGEDANSNKATQIFHLLEPEKTGIDFIFSISEMEEMLSKTGFQLKEIYSIPGKKQFEVGEPRAYIVAEKI